MNRTRCIVSTVLVLTVLATADPAPAKILKTKRQTQNEYKEFPLTIGSGFEYEGDSEEKTYDFPFLLEYIAFDRLTLTVEPDYVVIKRAEEPKTKGFGDLETSAVFELVTERRSRPSLAAEALVKWPASNDSLTTGEIDYSVGGVISKEFVHFDLDSEWLYTFVGDPQGVDLSNSSEISLAATWHLTRAVDVEAEAVTSSGGGFHGTGTNISKLPSSEVGSGEREWESTLGLSELLFAHLRLEEGAVYKSDGTWQFVSAWEWNFGEE
jgi:hypothetical protein